MAKSDFSLTGLSIVIEFDEFVNCKRDNQVAFPPRLSSA